MKAFFSNSGRFEPPGSKALTAFVTERERSRSLKKGSYRPVEHARQPPPPEPVPAFVNIESPSKPGTAEDDGRESFKQPYYRAATITAPLHVHTPTPSIPFPNIVSIESLSTYSPPLRTEQHSAPDPAIPSPPTTPILDPLILVSLSAPTRRSRRSRPTTPMRLPIPEIPIPSPPNTPPELESPNPQIPLSVRSKRKLITRSQPVMPTRLIIPDSPVSNSPMAPVTLLLSQSPETLPPMPELNSFPLPPQTLPVRPTRTKDLQGHLLVELYNRNIPATDIALAVKTMRGEGTKDEETIVLQRLFALSVPGVLIAQVVEAMRTARCTKEGIICDTNVHGMF